VASFAREIEECAERYANGLIGWPDFEDEVDMWLRAEQCDHCRGGQLCSAHYEQFCGGYWRPIPDETVVIRK
jgi:hypothetical protein